LTIAARDKTIEENNTEIAALQAQYASVGSDVSALGMTVKTRDETIKTLEKTVSNLRSSVRDTQAQLELRDEELVTNRAHLAQHDSVVAELTTRANTIETRLDAVMDFPDYSRHARQMDKKERKAFLALHDKDFDAVIQANNVRIAILETKNEEMRQLRLQQCTCCLKGQLISDSGESRQARGVQAG
jgi:chromosome segregation ATPase